MKILLLFSFLASCAPIFCYESYIVKFKKNAGSVKMRNLPLFKKMDVFKATDVNKALADSPFGDFYILKTGSAKLAGQLAQSEDIEYVEPNYIYKTEAIETGDPLSGQQWALDQVHAKKAWEYSTGEGVIIGLIDTGLDYDHPEFSGQLWINAEEDLNGNNSYEPWSSAETRNGVSGDWDNTDNDGNGYIDDVTGFDFVDKEYRHMGDDRDPDPDPADEGRHGTNVAGVMIAKPGNKEGIAGLAHGAKLMTVRAFDVDGNAESDDIASSILYAVLNGAKVINCSFGEFYNSRLVDAAVKFAYEHGCVVVASAGNEGYNLQHFPSDMQEVICAAGSSEKGLYGKTNYGRFVDLSAPAQEVYTTAVGGAYVKANGTSLAAPYVSAAAALLLSLHPELSPEEVRSIIVSGTDGYRPGLPYTGLLGSGTLNCENMMRSLLLSAVTIKEPQMDHIYKGSVEADISVMHPALEKFEILVSGAVDESSVIATSEIARSGMKVNIPVSLLSTADQNTLTVRLTLKNGRVIDRSSRFLFSASAVANKIESFDLLNGYFEDRSTAMATVRTLLNSTVRIAYAPASQPGAGEEIIKDYKLGRHHLIRFSEDMEDGVEYAVTATAVSENNDTVSASKNFIYRKRSFPNNTFTQKNYLLPLCEMNNHVSADLYTGSDAIVLNKLSGIDFGKVFSYRFAEDKFMPVDSLDRYTLPAGFCDSDGDGTEEVITTGNGMVSIYSAAEKNGNPFLSAEYSNMGIIYNALGAYDIDNDSREEVLINEDSLFYFIDYNSQSGNYDKILLTEFDKKFFRGTITFRARIGNFNTNKQTDIAFTNDFGHLMIYELQGSAFVPVFYDSTRYGNTNHYITSGDYDGDGIDEVVVGVHSADDLFTSRGSEESLWQYRMTGFAGGAFKILWKEYVYGVRAGIVSNIGQFKNGLASGNADKENGDELVISAYPNLYVMKWDNALPGFRPLWNFPFTFTNSALIHDFDKNGTKEIGFGSFSSSVFFEYNSERHAPAGFAGKGINGTTAGLSWERVENASLYRIYRKRPDSETGDLYGETSQASLIIDTLTKNTEYSFFLAAVFEDNTTAMNRDLVTLHMHDPYLIESAVQVDSKSILAHYNGSMPDNFIDAASFELITDNTNITPSVALVVSDTSVVLTFAGSLPPGEHTLAAAPFLDYYGSLTADCTADITIQPENIDTYLFITKGEIQQDGSIKVYFSEPLDPQSFALSKVTVLPDGAFDHYEIINGGEVILYPSSLFTHKASGRDFIIKFTDLLSANGKPLTKGAGSSVSFSFTADNLSDVFIYPSPIRLSSASEAVFAGLTARATVRIYTAAGDMIRQLEESNFNGGVEWDLTDSRGDRIEPGVYLFDVTGRDETDREFTSELKKIAVIR